MCSCGTHRRLTAGEDILPRLRYSACHRSPPTINVVHHSQPTTRVCSRRLLTTSQDTKLRNHTHESQVFVETPCAWGCDNVAPDIGDRPNPIISCWRI